MTAVLPTPQYAHDPAYRRIIHHPADVARLTPLGHPTINLDGRYRTTSRPPATGLRPLRID
jgi:hypothetical protein